MFSVLYKWQYKEEQTTKYQNTVNMLQSVTHISDIVTIFQYFDISN